MLLRTAAELAALTKRNPYGLDTHVTFLEAPADAKKARAIDPAPFAPDEFEIRGREVFVRCPNGYGTHEDQQHVLRAQARDESHDPQLEDGDDAARMGVG